MTSAIKSAAEATGAGFSYLLKTAEKESSLKPDAQASTSSARGLYQFIDQTWLSMVKEEGPKHGLARYAEAINRSNDGRYAVNDPALRKDILSLRDDPSISAVMAGAFTNRNANDLKSNIGRNPTEGELYMAHFLGSQGRASSSRWRGIIHQHPRRPLFLMRHPPISASFLTSRARRAPSARSIV